MRLIRVLLEEDRNGNEAACYKDNGKRDRDVDRTTAHKDHVHIELNWRGARRRTTFWRDGLG